MLTLTQLPNSTISIKTDYYYKDRIKKIPGARFDFDTKEWIIDIEMLDLLEEEFQGELVYKTPRWVIKKEPVPDASKMYQIYNSNIEVPELKFKPYDYQNYGIKFMIDRVLKQGFVLNADDVGLGKTIQTIGTMKWFIENKVLKRILIICKKSIKSQWIDEIKKFTDIDKEFNLIKTESLAKKRKKAYKEFNDSDKAILVTNYHSFLNDTPLFQEMDIDFIVIDEVHSVKARTGILNNNIGSITKNKPTVFLTGTPIMSKPEDIFGIVQMVNPNYFGLWTDFQKKYLTIDLYSKFGPRVVGAKHLDELRQKVQDIVIRRTEYEVAIQLPKTILDKIECDMDETQENLLQRIQGVSNEINDTIDEIKLNKNLTEDEKEKITKLEARSKGLIAARQAASTDPRLFLRSYSKMMKQEFGQFVPKTYKMSNKIESVIDLVEDILASDDKVILFTKFRTCAQLVAEDITSKLKTNVLMYTGAENDEKRDEAVYKFKNTTSYNILIGTEAMAEGLNLQCAKYVINIDQPDTFAIKTQRIGRARRTGSNFDNVIVYDMITLSTSKTKSKDEERLENISKNQNVTDALVSIDESQRQALIEAMKNQQSNV
jgi:SNF2 family DNA or RNA helicase